MNSKNGLESIKTAISSKLQSIPGRQRSRYLDLFMLDNRRKKLKKDCRILRKKLKNKMKKIDEVEKKILDLKREESEEDKKSLGGGKNIKNPDNIDNDKDETLKIGY
ncbi:MAG: hypothetical protein K9N00_03965 [Candidatus Marinimicrobia bacterium]|nr:hypothetical protein [Candidatus Neomarinimicrobiota bacterium]